MRWCRSTRAATQVRLPGLLVALMLAGLSPRLCGQPMPEPCGVNTFPLDARGNPYPPEHTMGMSLRRVPVVWNPFEGTGRRYHVEELGQVDPCASVSTIVQVTRPDGSKYFRWQRVRTPGSGGTILHDDLPASECVHDLVYTPNAAGHEWYPVVELLHPNKTRVEGRNGPNDH